MSSGGKREGAGRKPVENKRVVISVRVKPETAEKFREMKGKQVLGEILDKLAEHGL